MAAKFRFIGTTDETVECQQCGKTELRNTVVLALLDDDGNTTETVYYGSTCAARALGISGGSRRVLDAARGAGMRVADAARHSRSILDHYDFAYAGRITGEDILNAVPAYIAANPGAADNAFANIRAMVKRHQQAIAEANLIGA